MSFAAVQIGGSSKTQPHEQIRFDACEDVRSEGSAAGIRTAEIRYQTSSAAADVSYLLNNDNMLAYRGTMRMNIILCKP